MYEYMNIYRSNCGTWGEWTGAGGGGGGLQVNKQFNMKIYENVGGD